MDNGLKEDLIEIFKSGLEAVAPDKGLQRHIQVNGERLSAGGQEYDTGSGRVYVLAAGKGAAPMAAAFENMLHGKIFKGLVVVKYGHTLPIRNMKIIETSHPVPDAEGERAAREFLEIASETRDKDLLVCLFTGGASALLPYPREGLTLEDVQVATRLLLASGANIHELNAIRKHLSCLSGGQLAKAARAKILTIIVSDVIGDDPAVIASGPTAPDPSTFSECMAIINKYKLNDKLPEKVLKILEKGEKGEIPETPKPGAPCFDKVNNIIVASNRQALQASEKKAIELGYAVSRLEKAIEGEARIEAAKLIKSAEKASIPKDRQGFCLLAGGETTVQIMGNGLGGRNQEMALSAAIEITGKDCIGALFAGTDGTDGPTEANGGFAFGDTVDKMGGKMEAEKFLADNDSYNALKKAGELFITGPTMTNVMDMAIVIRKKY